MHTLHFLFSNKRFLAFGLMCTFGANAGQTFFIALFGDAIRAEFALSHGGFATLYSIATLISAAIILWAGRRIDDVDLRVYVAIVIGGLALSAAGMAVAGNEAMLVAALFGLRLFGQGLLRHTAVVSMARYFERTRGRAMSVVGLGYPLGEALLPAVAIATLAALGWRASWGWIAVGILVIYLPLVQLLLKGHTERHRAYEHAQSKSSDTFTAKGRIVADGRFQLILPAALMAPFLLTGVFFHQLALAHDKGWDVVWLAASFPAYAGATVAASLICGAWVDKRGPGQILPWFIWPLIASMGVIAVAQHPFWVPVYLALGGLTTGASAVLITATWAETFGTRRLGQVRAVASAFAVLATAAAPLLVGLALDGGTPVASIALSGGAIALVAGLLVLIPAKALREASGK